MKELCLENKQAGRACLVAAHEEGAGLLAVLLETKIQGVTPNACQQVGAHITLHADKNIFPTFLSCSTPYDQVELASFMPVSRHLEHSQPHKICPGNAETLSQKAVKFAWVPLQAKALRQGPATRSCSEAQLDVVRAGNGLVSCAMSPVHVVRSCPARLFTRSAPVSRSKSSGRGEHDLRPAAFNTTASMLPILIICACACTRCNQHTADRDTSVRVSTAPAC